MPSYEGGLRPYRLEWVTETTVGIAPSDPDWNLFSDSLNSFDPGIAPGVDTQRQLGDPDPQNFFAGTGSYTPTINYDLQEKSGTGNTLVDGSDNPNDAATDGFRRDADNRINNSHTIVRRFTQSSINASNTVNGSTSKDTRQYVVFLGAKPDPTLEHDPTSATPITVDLEYTAEKGEVHQIDQPPSDGTGKQIAVKSTDAGDTSQSVTIQGVDSADAAAEEGVALNGTTLVDTTTQFQEIDAVQLSAETVGNVEVYEDDDSTSTITQGDQLMEIKGQNAYDHGEGDLGVPALGTGSHASSIGQAFVTPHGTTIDRPDGTALSDEVMTLELAADNNFGDDSRTTGPRPFVVAKERSVTADVTVTGEKEYFDKIVDALTTGINDFDFDGSGFEITLDNAGVTDVSESEEATQGMMQTDVTIEGKGVTVTT